MLSGWAVLCLLAASARAESPLPPNALGRAGPVVLMPADFDAAVVEARILEQWRANRTPPLAALRSRDLRRQIAIKAMETRVVRLEAAKRGVQPDPDRLRAALTNAALGRPYNTPVATPLDDLDARLVARYSAPAERVRQVAIDLLEAQSLSTALLDAVDDATHRARWLTESTTIALDLVQVPRVPTLWEIEATVKGRGDDIDIWYAVHRARYDRPARAQVRRGFARSDPAQPGAAKARVAQWRAALKAGTDPAAIFTQGDGPEATNEGRIGRVTRNRLPIAFELEAGDVSAPIAEDGGWAIYLVEAKTPASLRPAHDSSVRREIAATLLREGDVLPHARQVAETVRRYLASNPKRLASMMKTERLKRRTTPAFAQSRRTLVPGIGLAPDLVKAAFALQKPGQVTPIVRVRQNYVVARLIERQSPDPGTWTSARAAYIDAWKAKEQPHIIEDWLTTRLAKAQLWIDMPRIAAIDIPGVGTAAPKRRGRGGTRAVNPR